MREPASTQVLIVGAGPTGLALACQLLRLGVRVRLVLFQRADTGERTTLFALLQPLRPVALLGPGPTAERLVQPLGRLGIDAYLVVPPGGRSQAALPCLIDVHGELRRLYGMTGEFLCLVRPDDHVGLFQRPIDEQALRDYLRRLCPADAVAGA